MLNAHKSNLNTKTFVCLFIWQRIYSNHFATTNYVVEYGILNRNIN